MQDPCAEFTSRAALGALKKTALVFEDPVMYCLCPAVALTLRLRSSGCSPVPGERPAASPRPGNCRPTRSRIRSCEALPPYIVTEPLVPDHEIAAKDPVFNVAAAAERNRADVAPPAGPGQYGRLAHSATRG